MLVLCVAVLSVLCFVGNGSSEAWADVITLRDGRRIEGAVIHESGSFISVRTADGVVTVERAEIEEHERAKTGYDDYLSRRGKLGDRDVEGHLGLAEWCAEADLLEESLFHFRMVLGNDPNHKEARKKLGYIRINGSWYIDGSPAADAAAKGDTERFTAPPVEMPDSFKAPERRAQPTKPRPGPSLSGAPRVHFKLRETVNGKAPELPAAHYELPMFFRDLEQPLSLAGPGGDQPPGHWSLSVTIKVRFLRTHRFYGKIPISHMFTCEASFALVDQDGNSKARISRLSIPFSGSARRPKEEVSNAAYYYTVRTLLNRMSKHPFFKRRGAKVVPEPDW